jgi:hypothetical protein
VGEEGILQEEGGPLLAEGGGLFGAKGDRQVEGEWAQGAVVNSDPVEAETPSGGIVQAPRVLGGWL